MSLTKDVVERTLIWERKQKTTETDGNVGIGMGQETENDRD
jgi:hypothetical protein